MTEHDHSERADNLLGEAEDARQEVVEAATEAAEAKAKAEDARDEAQADQQATREARAGAEHHRDTAQSAAVTTATIGGVVDPTELLTRPDEAPPEHEGPFGEVGAPLRRSYFRMGFAATMGALAALLVGYGLKEVAGTLELVLISMFLAVGLNPLVERLMRLHVRRAWAVLVVTLGFFGVVTLFGVALFPVVRDQVASLIESVPGWLEQLQKNQRIKQFDAKYDVIATINDKLQDPKLAESAFGSAFAVGVAVLSFLINAFIIFVVTLYFLTALPAIKKACYSLAPATRRARVSYLGDEILRRVGGYVGGVFVVASCAGISTFIFLEVVGLAEYAVALAIVVMITDFIPLIGATIGASIVSLIGFATDLRIGIICAVFFLIYQQVENYVIYPRVMSSSVDVPGVVTVIAVLIGGGLLGVAGAMMAIPTAAALLLLVQEVVVRKQDTR